MLQIAVSKALPGMVLATTVPHPQRPGTPLLKAGVTLDATALKRFASLGGKHVWINYPGCEGIDEFISSTVADARAQFCIKAAESFVRFSTNRLEKDPWKSLKVAIEDLAETLMSDRTAALFLNDPSPMEYWPAHAANVAFLSVLIGMKTGGYMVRQRKQLSTQDATNLLSLVTGALLHDVGMLQLDASTVSRWLDSRDETDTEWRKHPQLGYSAASGKVEPTAAAIILHHHQYFDGSGFPQRPNWEGRPAGLSGEQIHVLTRVVTAADLLDEARTMGRTSSPSPMVTAMFRTAGTWFRARLDPVILRTLLEVVPTYTPGTEVKLSDGREGYVATWNLTQPCRPIVAVIENVGSVVTDTPEKPVFVNLANERRLSIVETEGEDVSECQFELAESIRPRSGYGLQFRSGKAA